MTLRSALLFHLLCLGVLRCAALLVPRSQRREWWLEWRSELWHVRQACTPDHGISWQGEREVAEFCFGAFQDAHCLRSHSSQARTPHAPMAGSANQCVLFLTGLITVSFALAIALPGVRAEFLQLRYPIAPRIVLIQNARSNEDSVPTISADQFRIWKNRRQQLFDGFAFYQMKLEPASRTSNTRAPLRIAHSSANLFQLLGLPIRFALADAKNPSGVVLSDALWRENFAADPKIAGRTIRLGQSAAVVIGVAPAGSWRLPGKVDAWLLEPDSVLTSGRDGFVVAQMAPPPKHGGFGDRWRMSAPTPDGPPDDFLCVSLAERTHAPFDIFLFTVILACLALPATTSLPLGEYRVGSQKLAWPTRLRRWSFLASKIALLLPIVYLVSLDLAHLRPSFDQATSDYIQLVASFSICLFGLRWTLRDQRKRCPVCLRKLTHPARVGQPSRNFLAWNGTELICGVGHGLLHVPEMPTSWFSTQRWLYLDPSWQILFAETGLAPVYF
jgi:hypothetical protein